MSNLCIIQARTGSTRLPNKVLMDIEGHSVLYHVVNRVKQSKLIDKIVVAYPINDVKIKEECIKIDVDCYGIAGNENNCLARYYHCWNYDNFFYHYDNIIRITSDNPLICAEIIDKIIQKHIDEDNDLTSNSITETFPDGCDVEIFTSDLLIDMYNNAILPSHTTHVTTYAKDNKDKYRIGELISPVNYYDKRWTLDEIDDYYFIKAVYSKLFKEGQYFGYNDILELLCQYPELEGINRHIKRNEGYQKSLQEDQMWGYIQIK